MSALPIVELLERWKQENIEQEVTGHVVAPLKALYCGSGGGGHVVVPPQGAVEGGDGDAKKHCRLSGADFSQASRFGSAFGRFRGIIGLIFDALSSWKGAVVWCCSQDGVRHSFYWVGGWHNVPPTLLQQNIFKIPALS